MLKIKNLVNDLNNHAVNQFIVEYKNKVWFQSYDTIIAVKKTDGSVIISEDWNYSKTTRKHLYIWLRDYAHFYVSSYEDVVDLINRHEIQVVKTLNYP